MVSIRILLFALFIAPVAQASEISEMGANQYSVSRTSGACGFGNTGTLKSKLYEEAGQFCAARSLRHEVTSIQERGGVIGRRCASVTVEFRCVTAGQVSLDPSGRPPDRDMNHGPNVAADRGQFGKNHVAAEAVAAEASAGDRYDALAKLKSLLDSGAITQEEFDAEKAKLLSR